MNIFGTATPLTRNVILWANLAGLLVLASFAVYYVDRQREAQRIRDEEKPWLTYLNSPFPVQESTVLEGRVIHLTARRHSDAKVRRIYAIAASLISEDHPGQAPIAIQTSNVYVDPGDTTITSTLNRVPVNTPPGRYHVEGVGEIFGIDHSFTLPWASQSFLVVSATQ